jgi:hypothetical protein
MPAWGQGVGTVLLALGVAIVALTILVIPTVNRIHCDRQGPYYSVCRVRSFSLVGLPTRNILLDPLQGTQPQPSEPTPGYGTRLMLSTQNSRQIPFSRYGTTWDNSDRAATTLNAFLGNNQAKTLTYWDLVPAPLLLTVLGGGVVLSLGGLGLLWVSKGALAPPP